ncbi:unnamed protein product [Caenorhabditis sp. 36 PRJEB53466]|nr:unnamed protein product [Caenorhabditis sp. 36 PRJEB53466]
MSQHIRRVPPPPTNESRQHSSSSDIEHVDDLSSEDRQTRKRENNEVDPRRSSTSDDDESRDEPMGLVEVRKPVDPRRSSVSLDVFKNFRDPHDRKNLPAKDKTVYVEGPGGKFREMKKGRFWGRKTFDEPKPDKKQDDEDSVIPYLLRAPGQAFRFQRIYNQIANIIQGFLAGISVMLTIFAFNLEPDVLLSGYRYMSLPVHAGFMLGFSVGLTSALDRTGVYMVEHFTSKERLKATVYNNGLFTTIVWALGLIASLLCIQLESQLVFAPEEVPSDSLVSSWRTFNVFRAIAASLGFLLLAFKPDSDTIAKEIKEGIYAELELSTTDEEQKNIILVAMKMKEK